VNAQLPPAFWQLEQVPNGDGEVIVDSFAGGGGASTGIEMALGRSPDFAINHDAEALALHRANHPNTIHLSKNIYKVDPLDVVGRRKVGLLWASPDCKHFSKAKGGKPVKRDIRDLAWTVVLWAERVRPRIIILENVEEFQTWGPLVETPAGLMPCPDRRGETFREWVAALKKYGYKVEWKELRACDYGAPTTRKRLFLIARCDGQKIVWPAPMHGPGRPLPYRTAASDVIDWSIPCPSIFDTSEEIMAKYGIRAIRPLAENTMARIAKGVKRYVIDAAKPFVINLTHGVRISSAEDPISTVTAAYRGEKGIVVPHVTKFQSGSVGADVGDPMPTITANSFIKRPGGAAPEPGHRCQHGADGLWRAERAGTPGPQHRQASGYRRRRRRQACGRRRLPRPAQHRHGRAPS
jgi:DNA (cytosine-5)-methyltransferase 1